MSIQVDRQQPAIRTRYIFSVCLKAGHLAAEGSCFAWLEIIPAQSFRHRMSTIRGYICADDLQERDLRENTAWVRARAMQAALVSRLRNQGYDVYTENHSLVYNTCLDKRVRYDEQR